MESATRERIVRNAFPSLGIYALPVAIMFTVLSWTGDRPWQDASEVAVSANARESLKVWSTWSLPLFMIALGAVEFLFGLYERHWDKNEKTIEIACFVLPRLVTRPLTAYFSLQLLPVVLPGLQNKFA